MLSLPKLVQMPVVLAAIILEACGSGRPGYSPLSTPPEVAWSGAPPTYVSTPAVALSITATDTEGVKGVYALCGAQRWAATKQEDGTWLVTVQLPVVGTNTVAVWAEDLTSPTPNSGQGMDPPYQLTHNITYDPTPPSVTYDATYGSYSDERTLDVQTDANGIARVPAAYSIGPRLAIPLGGNIYKASSRLSGGAMTATELETTNAGNVPVLRFVVPVSGGSGASIAPPAYTAHVTCTGCGEFADATGTLLRSGTTSADQALFDLPLATETVPALAQVTSVATVSITLKVTDAAGNTSIIPGFNFLVHVLGPPVAVVEDNQYAAARNANSTYAYRISDSTYSRMWDVSWWATNQGGDPNVRLVRYIITNPTPSPVALQLNYVQEGGGSWRAVETWQWSAAAASSAFTVDGFSFKNPLLFRSPTATGPGCPGDTSMVCTMGFAHRVGDVASRLVCLETVPAAARSVPSSDTGTFSTSDVTLASYRIATELGNQERSPNTDPSGNWMLVPGAAGSIPGTLVVYVVRPAGAARSRALATGWAYTEWTGSGQFQVCKLTRESLAVRLDEFLAVNVTATVSAAQDNLFGVLEGDTRPYTTGAGLLGEVVQRINYTIHREPLATH